MAAVRPFTLPKAERLAGKKLVETLFKGGDSRSLVYFPLRAVYAWVEGGEAPVMMMVSVPKRCFKSAVCRNRVKRQVREAFRKHKHGLHERVAEAGNSRSLALAFIWLDNQLHDSKEVERRVAGLLQRIGDRI